MLGIAGIASLPVFADTQEIVNNNSFETINAKGIPTMWTVNQYFKKDDKMGTIEVVSEAAQDGKNCLLIKNSSKQVFHLYGNFVPVTAGDVVKMSAYVKGKGSFKLALYFYNDQKAWSGTNYPTAEKIENVEWDKKDFSITVPDGDFKGKGSAAFIRSAIVIDSNSEVFVDNFQGQIEKAPAKEAAPAAKE